MLFARLGKGLRDGGERDDRWEGRLCRGRETYRTIHPEVIRTAMSLVPNPPKTMGHLPDFMGW